MDYINGDNVTDCNGKRAFKDCEDGQDATSLTPQYLNGQTFEIMNLIAKAKAKQNAGNS